MNVLYDHWGALDEVDAEAEFREEPDLKRAWPQLKDMIEFGVEEEEGEEDAEPDH